VRPLRLNRSSPVGARGAVWLAVTVLAALVVPRVLHPSYPQLVLELAAIYVIATAGLNVAIGFSGQFQMAQAALMAIGAYTSAILVVDHGMAFGPAALISIAVVLAFGTVVALVSLRTRSHYLLLATFGLQLIALNLLSKIHATGGINGHQAPIGIPLGGVLLQGTSTGYSTVVVAVALLSLWLADWIKRSYVGLAFHASRQNERLVLSAGLSPGRFRFTAVLISSFYAAVAGILIGPILTFLVPDSFGLSLTLLLLLIVVVGGMGSVIGVAVAAVLLTVVNQAAQSASSAWPAIYGLTIMIVLVAAPSGLGGAARLLADLLARRWRPAREPVRSSRGLPRTAEPALADGAGRAASLSVSDIRRHFGGVKALDGVSLEVEAGSIHGLIGPNGSGKTTLFDVVCGFIRQSEGTIGILAFDISARPAVARVRSGMGRTFQLPNVLLDNTVMENVLLGVTADMPARHRVRSVGRRNGVWEQRADEALERVGLADLRDYPLRDLPYGNQRVVDLARVLAARPSILLLDEPGAGMSGTDRQTIVDIIVDLRAQGVTVVVVEHDMQLIMEICDRITVLSAGKVIAEGTPEEIGRDEAVIAAYLGEAYVGG
jgi:branched-chain amino acid transport system permease protein